MQETKQPELGMPAKSLHRKMRRGDVHKPREKFSPLSVTFTNILKVQKKRDSDMNDRHLLLLRSALQPRNLIGLSSMLYRAEDVGSISSSTKHGPLSSVTWDALVSFF